MEGKFNGITGFISCRERGVDLMQGVRAALENEGVRIFCWPDMPGEATDHPSSAEEHIVPSAFAIIIMDGTGFDNRGKEGVCAQLAEVRHIRARMNRTRKAAPFKVWRVIVQDQNGAPSATSLAKEMEKTREEWLFDHKDTLSVRGETLEQSEVSANENWEVDHAEARRVTFKVLEWLRSNIKALRPASAQKGATVNVVEQEKSYLDRVMSTWIESIVGSGAQGGPLDFRLARAVPLWGEDAGGHRHALSHWLFAPDARPLILRGGPGMGKRCALLGAAAVMARRAETRFKDYFESEAAQAYLKDGERLGEAQFVPVLLQAEQIARFVEGKSIKPDHVYAAVASELFETREPEKAQREAVAARMKAQSYALLIDGLETLRGAVTPRDLMAVLTQMRIALEGVDLKVVTTARAAVPGSDRAEVELQPLTDEQIELFMSHFVGDRFPAAHEKKDHDEALNKLRQARKSLRASATDAVARGALNEVFGTPLLLNAFCWTTLKGPGGFAERRTILSGELLNHIISQDMYAPLSDLTLTPKDQRELLQLLALLVADTAFNLEQARLATGAWLSKRRAIETEDQFHEVLTLLSTQTSLLVEQSGALFRFCTTFWPEQLAAEALASDPTLLQMSLGGVTGQKIATQSRVFTNACGLILNGKAEDRFDRSLDIPLTALNRAADTALSGEDIGHFVSAAAEALAIAAPRVARDAKEEPNARAAEACNAVAARYQATSPRWTLRQRDACLNNLARAARRQNAWAAATGTNALFDKVLGPERWVEFETERGAITLAARPVMFAEYDAFARAVAEGGESYTDAARLFDHAEAGAQEATDAQDERTEDVFAVLGARPAAPVQYITWYEAVAYCRWLTEQLRRAKGPEQLAPGEVVRLPTAEEFQAVFLALAGQGNYPWKTQAEPGDGGTARANHRDNRIGHATAVGVFPAVLDSRKRPVWDFASNVQIWTTPIAFARQDWWPNHLGAETSAEVAGGSWASSHVDLKQGSGPFTPRLRTRSRQIGMRLVKVRVE